MTECLLPNISELRGHLIGQLALEDEATTWSQNVGQQTNNDRVQYTKRIVQKAVVGTHLI